LLYVPCVGVHCTIDFFGIVLSEIEGCALLSEPRECGLTFLVTPIASSEPTWLTSGSSLYLQ
jgi:hypothetical protein